MYSGSVEGFTANVGSTPMYGYNNNYPVSGYDTQSTIQTLFTGLQIEGEKIKQEEQNYNRTVKNISEQLAALPKVGEEEKPIIENPKKEITTPSVFSGFLSVAKKVAVKVKDYFLGDGISILGRMAASLVVAAIMRKYPNTFAIPTLEGNWGGKYSRMHCW